jgi:ATP-dependent DNA helicase RecQ
MCVIGLIDDFTQDYVTKRFRILSTRKEDGMYYARLKEFLMRYYSEARAEIEIEKARMRKGSNEIHKCLGYLTEFIYDKVASKRRRAIDDMRNFCLVGIDDKKDWKEINEDLKDEIYYYFNSKFAREGYIADNGESFSLIDDTDRAKKSSFDIVYKYLRVIDSDVMGVSGSPKDNIRHLHGAVRLIRRSETDINAALCFLNVFCLLALKNKNSKNFIDELTKSYTEGYLAFREQAEDIKTFYEDIERFKKELNAKGRNIASEEDLEMFNNLVLNIELSIHSNWIEDFSNKYNN